MYLFWFTYLSVTWLLWTVLPCFPDMMSGDDDTKNEFCDRIFKFAKLGEVERRHFVLETPSGPVVLILKAYNSGSGYIYCEVTCEDVIAVEEIRVELSFKYDANMYSEEVFLPSAEKRIEGIELNESIRLTTFKEGPIIILCTFFYQLDKTRRLAYNEDKGLLIRLQEDLFKSGKFADFTIVVGDHQFKCHKVILASRSPVFDRMLTSNWQAGVHIILFHYQPPATTQPLEFIFPQRYYTYSIFGFPCFPPSNTDAFRRKGKN